MNKGNTQPTEDEIVSFQISDETLEAAGIALNSAAAATLVYCTAVMCPWEDS